MNNKILNAHEQNVIDAFNQIALDYLFVETLETRHSDRLDFHEVSVWGIKSALQAAFDAGRQAASNSNDPDNI
jgi:hypothetical protein